MNDQPIKLADVQRELTLIRATYEQLKRQIFDIGVRATRCQKTLIELKTPKRGDR